MSWKLQLAVLSLSSYLRVTKHLSSGRSIRTRIGLSLLGMTQALTMQAGLLVLAASTHFLELKMAS